MKKMKSLHNIEIEGCQFNTRLSYNLKTNHITIGTSYQYRDLDESKQYYKDNKDKIKEQSKQYRENNKDKIKEYFKEYNENNKEKINKYNKKYCENNKDKIKKQSKQYYKNNKKKIKKKVNKYYENNKDKISERMKQYWKDNRDPNATIQGSEEYRRKMSCAKRKIPIEDFDGFINNQYCYKFNESCKEQNRIKYNRECFICGKDEEQNRRKLSVHHVDMNKNQGCNGNNWKLIPLCLSCHTKVHTKLWQSRIEYLLEDDR